MNARAEHGRRRGGGRWILMCRPTNKMSGALEDKLARAVQSGDAADARRLLAEGADPDARVNEYTDLPGIATFGAMPEVTLLAYIIQAVVHGRKPRDAALRVTDALLNINGQHGEYAGADLAATFDVYDDDEWIHRDHNDYTFKISEHRSSFTIEEYIRYLIPRCQEQDRAFLDSALHLVLVARAREAANLLRDA